MKFETLMKLDFANVLKMHSLSPCSSLEKYHTKDNVVKIKLPYRQTGELCAQLSFCKYLNYFTQYPFIHLKKLRKSSIQDLFSELRFVFHNFNMVFLYILIF